MSQQKREKCRQCGNEIFSDNILLCLDCEMGFAPNQKPDWVYEARDSLTRLRHAIIDLERNLDEMPFRGVDSEKYFTMIGRLRGTAKHLERIAEH